MQITRTRSKYYVLSVLGALVVALGVLAVAPSAQAQSDIDPTIDKECTPNPVQLGGEIICTIDAVAATNAIAFGVSITDTFPAGLTVTGATGQLFIEGQPSMVPAPCEMIDNTVTCEIPFLVSSEVNATFRATITARADQCGTFPNTARAKGLVASFPDIGVQIPFDDVADTEQITVEGCEVPEPDQQQPNQQQGAPAPITQDFEQDSEAGEIDQSFDIS